MEKKDISFECEICSSTDCCERTNILGEPVLCDRCFRIALVEQSFFLFRFYFRVIKILSKKDPD